MCGITGFIDYSHESDENILFQMTNSLAHRGPDDIGYELYTTDRAMVGLGHRRLSIIDLSSAGHQPMRSISGRYVICFNGEIYNFQDIRTELENIGKASNWKGHTDTEVLLATIEYWGLTKALQKSIGMFALVLWDKKERALYLARDRMGEKPLYYGWQGKCFIFGSELKALQQHPNWRGEIDRGALSLYMQHSYIPAPYSIYKDIYKLEQGMILCIYETRGRAQELSQNTYWSLRAAVQAGKENPFPGDAIEAVDEMERLLSDAVGKQMVSDVPLGAFLSGGIDSSTIVSLMQAQASRPVKTFSIGFHESDYNEAIYSKAVAEHLGTDHTELYVSPQEALDVIPCLPTIYDEPFSDSSQIPTYLVSKLARREVTVALSGDGGDELFSGYRRYQNVQEIWEKIHCVPFFLRKGAAYVIENLPVKYLNGLSFGLKGAFHSRGWRGSIGDKIKKGARLLQETSPEVFYLYFRSHWQSSNEVVIGADKQPTVFNNSWFEWEQNDFREAMMLQDMLTYLPDNILTKVDRAAMSKGLETRIPLLDHRIIEYAWQLPYSLKVQNGKGKWILRQVLYKYVPKELVERPKKGFGVPIGAWLRGPLKDWAEELLSAERLKQEGLFHPEPICQKWDEHISGKSNWHYNLWDVLMFQAWLENERQNQK